MRRVGGGREGQRAKGTGGNWLDLRKLGGSSRTEGARVKLRRD